MLSSFLHPVLLLSTHCFPHYLEGNWHDIASLDYLLRASGVWDGREQVKLHPGALLQQSSCLILECFSLRHDKIGNNNLSVGLLRKRQWLYCL